MFVKEDTLFYIDLYDGLVQEGKFIEYDREGLWINLKGQSINTFVYSDLAQVRIFEDRDSAEAGLSSLRESTKARLLKNNHYIEDILGRLGKQEGDFYLGIIKEVLSEKAGDNE